MENPRSVPAKPNARFTENGDEFTTDSRGRVSTSEFEPELKKAPRSGRNQRMAGRGDGRLDTDVGGHLKASQLDGPKVPYNHVPMDAKLNSNHKVLGKWGQMENEWVAALRSKPPKKVKVYVQCIYADNSARPSEFRVVARIDGKLNYYKYLNQPGG